MPGRANATHCVNGHEFTESNTYVYVGRDGRTRRNCRTCARLRDRRKSLRKDRRFPYFPSYEC